MADGHALGPARGPRGVEDVRQVLGVTRHVERRAVPRRRLGPSEHGDGAARRRRPGLRAGVNEGDEAPPTLLAVAAQQVAVGHDGAGARVLEHVGHLGGGQTGVHGDGHTAGPVDGGVRDEPAQGQLGPQVDADAGVLLETRLHQVAGHGVGGTIPFGEGHGTDVDDGESRAVAELLGHACQVIVHQHDCRIPPGISSVRKVDASVRFVAAWPMRLPGVNPGKTAQAGVCSPQGRGRRVLREGSAT